jgi:hypothetical protein
MLQISAFSPEITLLKQSVCESNKNVKLCPVLSTLQSNVAQKIVQSLMKAYKYKYYYNPTVSFAHYCILSFLSTYSPRAVVLLNEVIFHLHISKRALDFPKGCIPSLFPLLPCA